MVVLLLLFLPALLHAAVDVRFGFVGTGGKAFSEKFKVPYYTLEGNYPTTGNTFSSIDPANDPSAGHQVVREVAKLNVRNDALGQTNAQFQTAFQAYAQSLATWYLIPLGPKPQFTWYSPNAAALAAAESLQIVSTIRREKTRNPAVTGTVWEIGNEPNLFPAILPTEYAAIFSNYYRIIKTEDPAAKVAFGSIFLRETAEDLKPKMQEALHQMLIDGGALSLLGQTRFNNLETDVQNTLFSRIFNLGTVEYVNQCFAAMASNVRPDYITLHVYPYDDRVPTLTKANIKTKVDSLVSSIGTVLSSRGFTAPVWITEFGNINSSLTEAAVSSNTSDLIDIFQTNSGIGNWFYYKATGADQQVAAIPGMTAALTRLAIDSAFSPTDSAFSCTVLNTIGLMYYLRATGVLCIDPTVPNAPTAVTGLSGNAQAVVFWTAPLSSGGSAITGYIASAVQDTTKFCTTTGNVTCAVTGLTNGTSYTFIVRAINAIGRSAASSPSLAIIPVGPPNPPISVLATAGNAQVLASWLTPAFNGGSVITSYTARAVSDTNRFCTTTGLSCTITGLTNGTTYFITVTASNAIGRSVPSPQSPGVTPRTVPDPPTALTGASGNTEVALNWLAPASSGGFAVTNYTVTAMEDTGKHCATTGSLTCIVTGLINGTPYTFNVRAANIAGSGLPSTISDTVIPRTVPSAPTAVIRHTGNARVTIGWNAPASDGGSPITSYTATAVEDTSKHCTSADTSTTCVVIDLSNGISYSFTVSAANAAGKGPPSAASVPVVPATVPGAATGVLVMAANLQATVSWTKPASDGGEPIIAYTVTAVQDNTKTCGTFGGLVCVVTGLNNSISYNFVVRASNIVGTGAASDPSSSVTSLKASTKRSLNLMGKNASVIDILGRLFRNKALDADTP